MNQFVEIIGSMTETQKYEFAQQMLYSPQGYLFFLILLAIILAIIVLVGLLPVGRKIVATGGPGWFMIFFPTLIITILMWVPFTGAWIIAKILW